MKDIIIKKTNHAYSAFFRSDKKLCSKWMIYSCNNLIYGYLNGLYYFKFKHKKAIQGALYDVSLKRKTIHLKFIKITGDSIIGNRAWIDEEENI